MSQPTTDTVSLPIACCSSCPNVRIERHYTSDSFEQVHEWTCAVNNMLHITYHEWNDGNPPIPKWCPLRK